ncbi:MAG: putative glycoside hydrolase [bacterium]
MQIKDKLIRRKVYLFSILAVVSCGAIIYFKVPMIYGSIEYTSLADAPDYPAGTPASKIDVPQIANPVSVKVVSPKDQDLPITHIKTPNQVRAIYSSAWVAGLSKYRDPLIKLIDTTELNSIVIDVKDSTGRIGFYVKDPVLAKYGSVEKRIPDVRALTNALHAKNIYVIGRVAVFQDPYMTKAKPEWAITKKSDGTVWKDHKGLSFLDPAKHEVWDYTVSIAREAYNDGFDEINFDYIRYPSDGDVKNINYHLAKGETRSDNLEKFFKYLNTELKKDPSVMMSADLFGLTTESTDDMGIGQVWEKALPYFDFLAPMVYPSHYPPGQDGFKNPADHPYEIINKALAGAVVKTTKANSDINKIRPWLQDFNLGATYTDTMIKAEMKAVYENKLSSWMLWDPRNKYTPSALELEN